MAPQGWLDAIVGSLHCAHCGEPYRRDGLRVIAEREVYVYVRCNCHRCGQEGVVVITFEAMPAAAPRTVNVPAPITADEVLDAHAILRDHIGAFDTLFRESQGAAARR